MVSRVLKGLLCGYENGRGNWRGERFSGVKNKKLQVEEESRILQLIIPTGMKQVFFGVSGSKYHESCLWTD